MLTDFCVPFLNFMFILIQVQNKKKIVIKIGYCNFNTP